MSSKRKRDRRWALVPLLVASALGCADFSRGASPPQMNPADGGGTADGQSAVSFATGVYPLLSICMDCHVPGGAAAVTSLLFTENATTDYATVLQFVDTTAPAGSRLLSKVSGNGHGGGSIYAAGSSEYETLLAWIQQGARP